MDAAPGFAELVIGPATSGRIRWLNPGYVFCKHRRRGLQLGVAVGAAFQGQLVAAPLLHAPIFVDMRRRACRAVQPPGIARDRGAGGAAQDDPRERGRPSLRIG